VEIDVLANTITMFTAADVQSDASGYLTTDSRLFVLATGDNELALTDSSPDVIAATMDVAWRDTSI
jgi:hypothetical protein